MDSYSVCGSVQYTSPSNRVICFSANSFKCSYIGSKRTREFAAGPVQPSSSTVSGCIKDDRATNAIIITRPERLHPLFPRHRLRINPPLNPPRPSPIPITPPPSRRSPRSTATAPPGNPSSAVTASTRRRRPPSSSSWSTTTRRNTKPFPSSSPNISPFSAAASLSAAARLLLVSLPIVRLSPFVRGGRVFVLRVRSDERR